MKNQYIGDIGDYGKYGLLRFLRDSGISVGVNWYLTPCDGRADGNHTEYLSDDRMRVYDPQVYDAMRRIAFRKDKTIRMVEREGILRDVCFYNALLDLSGLHWRERTEARLKWHEGALRSLQDVELVFAEPDNSLSSNKRPTQVDAQKYILPGEIEAFYRRGQQVLYYHHRSRKDEKGWLAEKRQIMNWLPDASLLALSFHRWTARTYIFVLHEDVYPLYHRMLDGFLHTEWGSHRVDGKVPFTIESI